MGGRSYSYRQSTSKELAERTGAPVLGVTTDVVLEIFLLVRWLATYTLVVRLFSWKIYANPFGQFGPLKDDYLPEDLRGPFKYVPTGSWFV